MALGSEDPTSEVMQSVFPPLLPVGFPLPPGLASLPQEGPHTKAGLHTQLEGAPGLSPEILSEKG